MTAQTMAQAKIATPESLWHFLAALPTTMEAQILYGVLLSGVVGMVANYTVKWARGEIAGSLWQYLFLTQFRATLLSFFGYMGLAITSIAAAIFSTSDGQFVGWATVLWFGATNGFAVDAIANRGDRKAWSPEERAAKTKEEPKP